MFAEETTKLYHRVKATLGVNRCGHFSVLIIVGAVRWGTRGTCLPNFLRRWGYNMPCCHILLFGFFVWRGFKNKSDVCRVFCEELFMLDVTHSQVYVETEFGVVSQILIFL